MQQLFFLLLMLFQVGIVNCADRTGLGLIVQQPTENSDFIVERAALKKPESLSLKQWHELTKDSNPTVPQTPKSSYQTFTHYLNQFIHQQKDFLGKTHWLNRPVNFQDPNLSDGQMSSYTRPFLLKYSVQAGSRSYFWGDLHGDIQALCACLYKLYKDGVIDNDFHITQPNCTFFFLGDMVDRGQHCIDTLTVIFIVASRNPGKVFLIRGNHETISMNKKAYYKNSPELKHFYEQLKLFYNSQDSTTIKNSFTELINRIALFYNTLPVAAFVGCNNNFYAMLPWWFRNSLQPTRTFKNRSTGMS